MNKEQIPGEIRVRNDGHKWTAEQWTGTHWLFLQIKSTRKELDEWIENDWTRFPVDTRATD